MTGWQLAMQIYQAAPTPLALRQPMNDTTGGKREPIKPRPNRVRIAQVEQWEALKRLGLTTKQIAATSGRTERTVRRYLTRESIAHD